jgi:hypothetical protein
MDNLRLAVAAPLDGAADQRGDIRFVFDNQNSSFGHRAYTLIRR